MKSSVMFHLAIPINDINQAKTFYCQGLGCNLGRANEKAIILDLYGNQLVAHTTSESLTRQKGIYPRHFGIIFSEKNDWVELLERAKQEQLSFYIEPKLRFEGKMIEHWSFFLEDPFHNLLEFKYYCNPDAILGGQEMTEVGDR
ncbi:MAG: VOC family protein [Microcystaceae cyanobacterium]